jgi:RES domain-containing protein
MLVFRICKELYANDLSGEGARLYGGRWNKIGTPLVYTSCFASLAVLELMVHFNRREISFPFIISCIEVNAQVSILDESSLPEDWTNAANSGTLHRIAEDWINQNKTVGLKVPSAILPTEHNLLLNPMHSDFVKVAIRWQRPFYFDARFFT